MEIYQLRTFVTVAQQGHLTQAAELLHLSQPAVTAQVKALEEEVGMPLFERSTAGVRLTQAGQTLLPQAQAILAQAAEFRHRAQALRGELAGKVQVGISLLPEMLRLGEWVSRLVQRYPLLDLKLQHGVTGDVLNLVRKKELDAGFYLGKNPYVNVNTVALSTVSLSLVAPAAWAERLDGAGARELGRLPWVGMSQFSSLSRITAELWRELNISPRKVVECDHMAAALDLVAAGLGLALARDDEAQAWQAAGRVRIVPGVSTRADLHFVYPAERDGDPLLAALLAELAAVWQLPPAQ